MFFTWLISSVIALSLAAPTIQFDQLTPGQQIVFSNGHRYTFEAFLGEGRLTKILAIAPNRALRLPLKEGKFQDGLTYAEHLQSYLAAYLRLERAGVPVVKVFVEESVDGEYLVTERVDVKFTLEQFLDKEFAHDREERRVIYDRLVEFAATTWKFAQIGDLEARNIVWNGTKWLALDFGNFFMRYTFDAKRHMFVGMNLPEHVAARIEKAIRNERVKDDQSLCRSYLMKRKMADDE